MLITTFVTLFAFKVRVGVPSCRFCIASRAISAMAARGKLGDADVPWRRGKTTTTKPGQSRMIWGQITPLIRGCFHHFSKWPPQGTLLGHVGMMRMPELKEKSPGIRWSWMVSPKLVWKNGLDTFKKCSQETHPHFCWPSSNGCLAYL